MKMTNQEHISECNNGHKVSSQKQGYQTSDYTTTNKANNMVTGNNRSGKQNPNNTIIDMIKKFLRTQNQELELCLV